MANPGGKNQLSPHGYGDVQRQTQLKRAAPISGAPLVGSALNSPQRDQRQASRPQAQPQGQPGPEAMPGPAPTPEAQVGAIWQQLAAMPGASDLVKAQVA